MRRSSLPFDLRRATYQRDDWMRTARLARTRSDPAMMSFAVRMARTYHREILSARRAAITQPSLF